jgi:hypothetical protein
MSDGKRWSEHANFVRRDRTRTRIGDYNNRKRIGDYSNRKRIRDNSNSNKTITITTITTTIICKRWRKAHEADHSGLRKGRAQLDVMVSCSAHTWLADL